MSVGQLVGNPSTQPVVRNATSVTPWIPNPDRAERRSSAVWAECHGQGPGDKLT